MREVKSRELELLKAAREVISDFCTYGEVLQTYDGEYGTKSSIGQLQIAIDAYAKEQNDEKRISTIPRRRI